MVESVHFLLLLLAYLLLFLVVVIATLGSIIQTKSTLLSARMMQPLAIAVIVAVGAGSLISSKKGKG